MAKNIMEVLGSKQQKPLQSLVELLFKSQAEAHQLISQTIYRLRFIQS